jgi:hypothetical protein
MMRRPTWCLLMMARWVMPPPVARRIAAYFSRLAARLRPAGSA